MSQSWCPLSILALSAHSQTLHVSLRCLYNFAANCLTWTARICCSSIIPRFPAQTPSASNVATSAASTPKKSEQSANAQTLRDRRTLSSCPNRSRRCRRRRIKSNSRVANRVCGRIRCQRRFERGSGRERSNDVCDATDWIRCIGGKANAAATLSAPLQQNQ